MTMADWAGLWAKPGLLRAVLDFNNCFQPPDFGPARGRPLGAALAAATDLWALFPRPPGGLPPRSGFWDFEAETRRLALLPPPVLTRLMLYWGAALIADETARVIRGADLRRLQAALGPDLYGYAVKRGRYQLGLWPSPEPLDFTPEQPARLGRRAFDLCRADWPEELRKAWWGRWTWAGTGLDFERPASGEAPRGLWPGLKKIILSEAEPSWRACFHN